MSYNDSPDGPSCPGGGVTIPADEALTAFEFSGKPLVDLGDESPVYRAVEALMKKIL